MYNYYENRIKKDIIKANRPVASAKANPKIANGNTVDLIPGFLATDDIKLPKIVPIPIPAPISPEAPNPAPIYRNPCTILCICLK